MKPLSSFAARWRSLTLGLCPPAALLLATAADAHPGHGESGLHGGFLHAWLGWDHGLVLLVAVLIAWRWLTRR